MDVMSIEYNRPFLSEEEDDRIILLKYISEDLKKKIVVASEDIESYLFLRRKVIEIENNAADYKSYASSCLRLQSGLVDINSIYINLNRLFINFSTSVRVFTHLIESKIKSTYNVDSPEYEKFEKIRKNFYESFFSYRFIYHIRNFSLKYQYPIYFINLEYDNYTKGIPNRNTIEVMFDKGHLLKNKEFAKKMSKHLEKYGEKFPVAPLVEDTLKWLPDFFLKFINIDKIKFISSINVVENIIGNIYAYKHLGISEKKPTGNKTFKISTVETPIKAIIDIKKIINKT